MSVYFDPEGNVVDPRTAIRSHGLTPAQQASKAGLRVNAPVYQGGAAQQQSPRQVIVVRQAPASPQQQLAPQYVSPTPQLPASWSAALPPGVQVRQVPARPQVRQVSMQELMKQGTPGAGALALAQPQAGGGTNIVDMLIKASAAPVKARKEDAAERAQRQEWEGMRAGGGAAGAAPPLRRAGGEASSPGSRLWVRKGEGQPASPQHRPARMPVQMMGPGTGRMRSPRKTSMRMGGGDGGGGERKAQMKLDAEGGGGGRRRRRR